MQRIWFAEGDCAPFASKTKLVEYERARAGRSDAGLPGDCIYRAGHVRVQVVTGECKHHARLTAGVARLAKSFIAAKTLRGVIYTQRTAFLCVFEDNKMLG